MKTIDLFCASQTATAIRHQNSPSSTPSSSSAFLLPAAAAIDRHNPTIRDPKSLANHSHPSVAPKSQKAHPNNKENRVDKIKKSTFNGKRSWKCTNPGDFITPPSSSRFLLREKEFSDAPPSEINAGDGGKMPEISEAVKKTEDALFQEKPHSPPQGTEQVVVLRVSLHCRGCERKLRKHLSRMEGISSYNIEFAAKKVTVTGNASPSDVLTSISKVKNAQLWSPTITSTPNLITESQIKNHCKEEVAAA